MKRITRLLVLVLLIFTAILTLSACGKEDFSNTPSNNSSYNPIDYPTNNSCIHDWEAPTCLEPAQCSKCDAYKRDGKIGEHNYHHATCQEPAKCYYCGVYKDDKFGNCKFLSDGYCLYCGKAREE